MSKTTVKFDHQVKYKGEYHPAHSVFEIDDGDLDALKASGATVIDLSDELKKTPEEREAERLAQEKAAAEAAEKLAALKEELMGYTVEQLKQFAAEHNIDIKGKTAKADIFNAIVSTL